jgi:ribosomal protein S18 acetylase RimI-like enzyme
VLSVRPIAPDELEWFAGLDPATTELADQVRELWDDGSGRPEWTLVAEDGATPVGRVAFYTEPLGCGLATLEGRLGGLWVDWDVPTHADVAGALLDTVAERARPVTPFVERRLNAETHRDVDRWRRVLGGAGFTLFQEKAGFVWTDDGGDQPEPERLAFRPIADVGPDAFASAMGAVIRGTLDRNDRWYLDACGPEGWGREMVGALDAGDEDGWLLASEPDGTLAGYVAVGGFEPHVGTIVHVGVAPDRRGRGHIDELLRAANLAARRLGYRSMLSDVDTENGPMLAAMERNGHLSGVRRWHVWALRRELAGESR